MYGIGGRKTGAKYDAKIMRSKWESFKGSGTTIGSLVYQAKQGGWKPNVITQIIEKKLLKMNQLIITQKLEKQKTSQNK